MRSSVWVSVPMAIIMPAVASDPAGTAAVNKVPVVAEVDGVKLTREEFDRRNAVKLFQARNSYYEAERKELDDFIDERLVEQQARKEHVSVNELFERHVTSKLAADPTDEALRVYFEGLDTKESFEAMRPKILEHLRQKRIERAKTAYLQSLRSAAIIEVRLAAPRAKVSVDKAEVRGDRSAPVTFVEYADYECPYCQEIAPALEKLEAAFKGKLAFVYKDVPLPNHANAQKAAEGKLCAGQQGKYWDFHDLLVRTKQLQAPNLKQHARTLKLDGDAFDKCLDSGAQAASVRNDVAEAQGLGVQGTPSFFVNGRFFSGVLSYDKLREIVQEEVDASVEAQRTARR